MTRRKKFTPDKELILNLVKDNPGLMISELSVLSNLRADKVRKIAQELAGIGLLQYKRRMSGVLKGRTWFEKI